MLCLLGVQESPAESSGLANGQLDAAAAAAEPTQSSPQPALFPAKGVAPAASAPPPPSQPELPAPQPAIEQLSASPSPAPGTTSSGQGGLEQKAPAALSPLSTEPVAGAAQHGLPPVPAAKNTALRQAFLASLRIGPVLQSPQNGTASGSASCSGRGSAGTACGDATAQPSPSSAAALRKLHQQLSRTRSASQPVPGSMGTPSKPTWSPSSLSVARAPGITAGVPGPVVPRPVAGTSRPQQLAASPRTPASIALGSLGPGHQHPRQPPLPNILGSPGRSNDTQQMVGSLWSPRGSRSAAVPGLLPTVPGLGAQPGASRRAAPVGEAAAQPVRPTAAVSYPMLDRHLSGLQAQIDRCAGAVARSLGMFAQCP